MKNKFIIAFIIVIILTQNIVLAADYMYKLMHNEQDALIVGQVESIEDDYIIIEVSDQINSILDRIRGVFFEESYLNEDDNIKVEKIDQYSNFNEDNQRGQLKLGDYILVSLDELDNYFSVKWGIYKLNSNKIKELDVIYPKGSESSAMDAYSIKVFINSNGRKKDFSYDYDENKVFYKNKLIYDDGEVIDSSNIINPSLIWSGLIIIILILLIYAFRLRKKQL